MNQNGSNTRGIEGLLNGKGSLEAQIEGSLAAAEEAMATLRVAMAFKAELDTAVAKFQRGMAGIGGGARREVASLVSEDPEEQSVEEIYAEYKNRKSRLTI